MRLLLAILMMAAAASAGAQLYRWTDDKGKVHFSDSPPPPGARDVRKKGIPVQVSPAPAATPGVPFAVQQAMKDFPVTLYSTPGCEACDLARKLLNARGVPFKEVSVSTEKDIADLKSAVGSNSVPSMLVGAGVVMGFEEGAYQRALDHAGYPKTGVVPPRAQPEPSAGEPKPEEKKAAAPKPAAKKNPYYSPDR